MENEDLKRELDLIKAVLHIKRYFELVPEKFKKMVISVVNKFTSGAKLSEKQQRVIFLARTEINRTIKDNL